MQEDTQPEQSKAQQPAVTDIPKAGEQRKNNPLMLILAAALVLILIGLVGYIAYTLGKSAGQNEKSDTDNTVQEGQVTETTTQTEDTSTQDDSEEDPYEGWKTYENEDCGYSFRYPTEMKIDTTDTIKENQINLVPANDTTTPGYTLSIYGCSGEKLGGWGWCADNYVPITISSCTTEFSTVSETITVNNEEEELQLCQLGGITVAYLVALDQEGEYDEATFRIDGKAGTLEMTTIKLILESFEYN
jgi:hypothetical protein